MDLLAIQNGLRDLFINGTGLEQVVWVNERQQHKKPVYGVLELTSMREVGIDYYDVQPLRDEDGEIIETPATVPNMIGRVRGNREFVWNCQVESLDQRANVNSFQTLMSFVGRLRSVRFQEFFNALGLAYSRNSNVVKADYILDDRFVSRSSVDLFLYATEDMVVAPHHSIDVVEVGGSINPSEDVEIVADLEVEYVPGEFGGG